MRSIDAASRSPAGRLHDPCPAVVTWRCGCAAVVPHPDAVVAQRCHEEVPMIRRKPTGRDVKVTFALPTDSSPARVSVVGDFNSWILARTP